MKYIPTILAFCSSLTALADGEPEQYICVAETTTGFEYVFDHWEPTDFGTHKSGWLLNRLTPIDNHKGAWRLWKPYFDRSETKSICEDDFDEYGELLCGGRVDSSLKRDTLEFALVGTEGTPYLSPFGGDGLWAVYVSSGTCVPTSDQIPPWPRKAHEGLLERVDAFQEMIEELYGEMYGSKEESAPPIKLKTKESN